MFSSHWHNNNHKQADGSYFIDADPELFAHVLRYLRHGQLPIFYANGQHDFSLYAALLGEARYFQIDRLVGWLEKKKYFEAVKIKWIPDQIDGTDLKWETTSTNEEIEYHPFQTTERVYVCPREIPSHRGNRHACGRQCEDARGNAPLEYVKEYGMRTLVIRKRVVFNHALCFEV